MSAKVSKVPEGQRLIPFLSVDDAARAIDFYVRGFGAREIVRLTEPGGRIAHAEIEIDGVRIMLAEEYPELGFLGPVKRGGSTGMLTLYVEDVDARTERAVAAGAVLEDGPKDEFYGERTAKLRDPAGHRWALQARLEDVSSEELKRRFDALVSGG